MTALGGQLYPAEFCIRPAQSALPCVAREMRQWLEILDPLRRLVVFAKSILPGQDDRSRRLRRRLRVRAGDETFAQPDLHRCRRPLKNETVELFNAALRILERGDFRPSGERPRPFHHEGAVHEKQRLLRDGCREAARAGRVRAGEIERAEHAR